MNREKSFGRVFIPDERDTAFPMQSAIEAKAEVPEYHYSWEGWQGDQGPRPTCVAYAWLHWLEAGPVTHAPHGPDAGPLIDPEALYTEAQRLDDWPGEEPAYEGTSVRAGAKALQARGLVGTYRWAFDAETVMDAILTTAPVVLGSYWMLGMMEPDDEGIIRATGPAVGGHAYLAIGGNRDRGMIRILNSWGEPWGEGGRAWLPMEDLEKLLGWAGEAALAEEFASDG